MMRLMTQRKTKKGQTALEYALVVSAITLVIMVAWNAVGKEVQDGIMNTILPKVRDNLNKGNGSIPR